MKSMNTKRLTYTALMMALVFIGTYAIKIPTGNGYIHPGDGFVFLSGLILGPVYGALAAGIGSALSDIIGGYVQWALPTFIIKALMAYIVGYIALKKDDKKVIFIVGTFFTVIWISFNFYMKNLLIVTNTATSTDVMSERGLENLESLAQTTSGLQNSLLLFALLVPVILWIAYAVIAKITAQKFSTAYSLGFIIAGSLMVILYYFTAYILYGSYITPIFDIPANMIQFAGGLVIAHLLLPVSQKIIRYDASSPS